MKKTLYQYINVDPTASEDQIKTACQKRIQQCEIALGRGEQKAASMLMIIKDVQKVLLDEKKRRLYDNKLNSTDFYPKKTPVKKEQQSNFHAINYKDIFGFNILIKLNKIYIFLSLALISLNIGYFSIIFLLWFVLAVIVVFIVYGVYYYFNNNMEPDTINTGMDIDNAITLYLQDRVSDALLAGGKSIIGQTEAEKIMNLMLLIDLRDEGFTNFEDAKGLYAQGRKEEALVISKSIYPEDNIDQIELFLQGFTGLDGAKTLYAHARVEDAVILFKTVNSIICPPIIGLAPNYNSLKNLTTDSKAESILMLQLISYPKSDYLTIACRGLGGGFLLYCQDKKIVLYNIDNKDSIEFWDLSFKEVLGTAIVKNEKQIIKTTKPNGIGNAIVGGLLLGGDGAIVASVLSSEKTTSTTEINKMTLEIVLDCKSHPVHRMDCTKNPEDIDIFQTLLELVMLDVSLPKQQEFVDIQDHIRMLRLKYEREKHEVFNIQ